LPNHFVTADFPGAVQTQVIGINNAGDLCGSYMDQAGVTHGFVRIDGSYSTVDFPGSTFNQLLGLNDDGEAAGYYQDSAGTQYPYTVQNGMFTTLDSILPANTSAQATGVNNAGEASGFLVVNEAPQGFLLNGSSLTTLTYPYSRSTQALGLNNIGQVVGTFVDTSGIGTHGFVYDSATQTYQSYDNPVVPTHPTIIKGINDSGQIVGVYIDGFGNTDGFLASPVGGGRSK
jgi:hypothetical protein